MKKLTLITLLGTCGLALFSSPSWAWQVNINGTANLADEARAAVVDGDGNVIVVGFTTNADTGRDILVVKSDGVSGEELWRRIINGTGNGADEGHAVAVDGDGNVLVAGFTTNSGTGGDFTVVKLSVDDGSEQWRQVINGNANSSDQAVAVTVDTEGNVVAAGFTTNTETGVDFTVVKLDGVGGDELWRQVISGTANAADRALAVAVDTAGNVVAAGFIYNTSPFFFPFRDFTVAKFAGTSGEEIWSQVIKGTSPESFFVFDETVAVTVDGAGDVVAAGFTENIGINFNFTVAKLDGTSGEEIWRQLIKGNATSNDDFARAVTVDGDGNIVAAGSTENTGTGFDFTVVKLDGVSGAEIWRRLIVGAAILNDERALAVTVDGAANVVAAGFTENTGAGLDLTAVKLDGISGQELWRRNINGTNNGDDRALAVAVDAEGDVVAAGVTRNTGTFDDFTVVKLRGEDGGDF